MALDCSVNILCISIIGLKGVMRIFYARFLGKLGKNGKLVKGATKFINFVRILYKLKLSIQLTIS